MCSKIILIDSIFIILLFGSIQCMSYQNHDTRRITKSRDYENTIIKKLSISNEFGKSKLNSITTLSTISLTISDTTVSTTPIIKSTITVSAMSIIISTTTISITISDTTTVSTTSIITLTTTSVPNVGANYEALQKTTTTTSTTSKAIQQLPSTTSTTTSKGPCKVLKILNEQLLINPPGVTDFNITKIAINDIIRANVS